MLEILSKIKSVDFKVEQKKNDFIFKSKDRVKLKEDVERFLKANKIQFKSVFKKSKSSSLDILEVGKFNLIFKPIIVKGAGGISFEKELEQSLQQWISSEQITKHSDVVSEISKHVDVKTVKGIIHEGGKNQKRNLDVSNGRVTIGASEGKTLTDITLDTTKGKVYLSLKMSATYYVISASIFQFMNKPATRDMSYEFFGLDGAKMGGFGTEYFSATTKEVANSIILKNLTELLSDIYGSGYIMVHKNGSNVNVADFRNGVNVKVTSIDGYVYPEAGVRKYVNIKTSALIGGKQYKIDWQFRGTTAADVGPKYLRVLIKT
jgi:hypothetical protein